VPNGFEAVRDLINICLRISLRVKRWHRQHFTMARVTDENTDDFTLNVIMSAENLKDE
jgi:hypothetical protein